MACFAQACGESREAFCGEEPWVSTENSNFEGWQPLKELAESLSSLWADIAM